MNAAQPEIDAVLAQINRVILGKDRQIRLCLACLLAASVCGLITLRRLDRSPRP